MMTQPLMMLIFLKRGVEEMDDGRPEDGHTPYGHFKKTT
jgi:hypothetical protein